MTICFMGNKHENEKNEMMERNVIFALFVCPFFAYVRSKARTAMRGRRLVGGIWKDKKEVIWHSDRVGRFPSFFNYCADYK